MRQYKFLAPSAGLLLNIAFACGAIAQNTPPGSTDFDDCKALWEGIGLPEYTRPDELDTTPVCHTKYVLSHNNENKTPDWVVEHLTKAQITGTNKRPKMKFQEDKLLDKRATDGDYTNSKFDRGHQAPSDDFKAKNEWMVESFFLSNIVPQVGAGFNRDIWKNLEDNVRDLVRENRGELYVITGPVPPADNGKPITITANSNACGNAITIEAPKREAICGSKTKCDAGVAVPAALFKIIYDPGLRRANAFIMPNINHRDASDFSDPVEYLKKFQTTVQVVQKYTDLRLFTALSKREQRPVVEQCASMMLH